jgi:arylsulfatase A-like enzyme
MNHWSDADIQNMIALYYGTVTHIDDSVGRIVAALEEKGIADNTVIIINSDHGDYLGNRRFITKAPFIPYEDTIRVPFIVYDPRNKANGRVSNAFVNILDLFPTLASMTGVSHNHTLHGHDLTPLLNGDVDSVTDVVVAENPWGVLAVRQGAWKLIQSEEGVCELYELEEDPGERNNRYPTMQDSAVVHRLRDAALRYLMHARWDRLQRDIPEVRRVIEAEARERDLPMLPVEPEDWREVWSEAGPELIG